MKIRFEMKTEFSEKDPHILIQAAQLTDQAREVMEYLEQFSTTNQVVIPIRTDDHLVMVKIEDLILADIASIASPRSDKSIIAWKIKR